MHQARLFKDCVLRPPEPHPIFSGGQLQKLAHLAQTDPRTALKWLALMPTHKACAQRLEAALAALVAEGAFDVR